jgi:SAM-dependent methyltransferase
VTAPYVIGGGQQGKDRLRLLSDVLFPTTSRLLRDAGLARGMRCLDVACGGGHVTLFLAREVGPDGAVVGTDADAEILALARADAAAEGLHNVEFRLADVQREAGAGQQDLIYARFILTHLRDPRAGIEAMLRASRPGGMIVIEDIDFSGSFCHPHTPAYQRHVELYRQVVQRRGGDSDIGPRLPGLLRDAGLQDVRVNVVQPVFLEGPGKAIPSITMQRIAASLIGEGLAAADEIESIVAGLDVVAADRHTLVGLPRIFQCRARCA